MIKNQFCLQTWPFHLLENGQLTSHLGLGLWPYTDFLRNEGCRGKELKSAAEEGSLLSLALTVGSTPAPFPFFIFHCLSLKNWNGECFSIRRADRLMETALLDKAEEGFLKKKTEEISHFLLKESNTRVLLLYVLCLTDVTGVSRYVLFQKKKTTAKITESLKVLIPSIFSSPLKTVTASGL